MITNHFPYTLDNPTCYRQVRKVEQRLREFYPSLRLHVAELDHSLQITIDYEGGWQWTIEMSHSTWQGLAPQSQCATLERLVINAVREHLTLRNLGRYE